MTPYNAQGPLSLTTESLYISGSNRIGGVVTQVVFPMTSYDNNQLESVAETTKACVHKSSNQMITPFSFVERKKCHSLPISLYGFLVFIHI